MGFPITSKVLMAGLVILVLFIILALWLLYSIAKNSGITGITSSISGYNASGHNSSGYNASGYNRSAYNSSVSIVKKGGPV